MQSGASLQTIGQSRMVKVGRFFIFDIFQCRWNNSHYTSSAGQRRGAGHGSGLPPEVIAQTGHFAPPPSQAPVEKVAERLPQDLAQRPISVSYNKYGETMRVIGFIDDPKPIEKSWEELAPTLVPNSSAEGLLDFTSFDECIWRNTTPTDSV